MRQTTTFALVCLMCSCWSLSCCAMDGCPTNCSCMYPQLGYGYHKDMQIFCGDRHAALPDTVLMQQLEVILANNTQLRRLIIAVTPLTHVPAVVCNLTLLEDFYLEQNGLVALPDNCLSRMSQLRTFWANNTDITHLQVLLG